MIHMLAQQPAGQPSAQRQTETVINTLAPQPALPGFDWMLLLQILFGLVFAIVIGAFIWWLVQSLIQLGTQLGQLSLKLDTVLARLPKPQTPVSAPQHALSGDVLINFNKTLDSAVKMLDPIKLSAQKMQDVEGALSGLKGRLEELLSEIQKKEEGLSAEKAELARLRSDNPALELKIKKLEQELYKLQDELNSVKNRLSAIQLELDSEKAAHDATRSGLEGRLTERVAELSLV